MKSKQLIPPVDGHGWTVTFVHPISPEEFPSLPANCVVLDGTIECFAELDAKKIFNYYQGERNDFEGFGSK